MGEPLEGRVEGAEALFTAAVSQTYDITKAGNGYNVYVKGDTSKKLLLTFHFEGGQLYIQPKEHLTDSSAVKILIATAESLGGQKVDGRQRWIEAMAGIPLGEGSHRGV